MAWEIEKGVSGKRLVLCWEVGWIRSKVTWLRYVSAGHQVVEES